MAQALEPKINSSHSYLIYSGKQIQQRSAGVAIPWKESAHLINQIKEIIHGIKQ